MEKSILTDAFIALALMAAGAVAGYVYSQQQVINRCDEVLDADTRVEYNSNDLQYIALGYRNNTNFDN